MRLIHAIILAAGYGTRLGKIGEQTPKGLISLNGTTLIGKCLNDLFPLSSITDISIITNHRFYPNYTDWIKHAYPSKEVTIYDDGTSSPENRLGALGDLLFVIEENKWQNDSFFIIPSDTYYEFSFANFLKFSYSHPEGLCTVFRSVPRETIANRLGCAEIIGDNVINFVEKPEKPPTTYAAIPFYFYPEKIINKIYDYKQSGNSLDAPGSIIPWLIQHNYPVYSYITNEKTLDVGTIQEVEKLQWMSK